MARPVQTPPRRSNSILSRAELKGSSASSRLMSNGDCFRAGTLVFPVPSEGLILFITEIKQAALAVCQQRSPVSSEQFTLKGIG